VRDKKRPTTQQANQESVNAERSFTQGLRHLGFLGLLIVSAGTPRLLAQARPDAVRQGFENPPQTARPQVWWHWMNGNVSREGAELDLAWLKRMGIGGVHIFSGALLEPTVVSPPVPFMSPVWKETFKAMTAEARQAGMDVTIAGSPGWSETGGTWVAPEDAMKKYVWSETAVEGGLPFTGKLNVPPSVTGPFQGLKRKHSDHIPLELDHDVYRDSVVVAFPTPTAARAGLAPTITSNARQFDLGLTQPYGLAAPDQFPIGADGSPPYIQASYSQPVSVRALTIGLYAPADLEIQAADDAGTFHTILKVPADRSEAPSPQTTFTFPATRTKLVRAIFTPVTPLPFPGMKGLTPAKPKNISLTYIAFHTTDRVNHFEAKAGFASTVDFGNVPTPEADREGVIASQSVLDLTSRLRPDGSLNWTPTLGNWTVLRVGYSLTGQTNAPAEASATGLEVDKLDSSLVRKYMEHYLTLYDDASGGKLGASGVQNVLTDSWEAGVQNWTPSILAQFKDRRGYDATSYLPVLAGWVVNDAKTSDRFLWDFHRSLKDMVADDHYGTLASVMHEHHMGYYTEAEGDYPRSIGDGMTMKSRSDIPTGEFWYRAFSTDPGQPPLRADLEESASVAHVYGKKYAASESFTVGAFSDPWSFSPAMLKPVADEIFARGTNRILLHESHHQPFVDKRPGLELALFGQYFNRNETWAEQAKPWVDYLARTSFLLQQGQYVADVAYFYGEDRNLSELYLHRFNTDVPKGFSYDYINPEALLKLLFVKNGKLVTPSGMTYRVLYLPSYVDRLTLPALNKIRHLVKAGAVIVAAKPKGGLGLLDDDQKFHSMADQIWGSGSQESASPHAYGTGRIYATNDLASALRAETLRPDIQITAKHPDSNIMTVHRHTRDQDIYFLSNQRNEGEDVELTFRLQGMAPELWRAEDGSVSPVNFKTSADGTTVPMHMEPNEAMFLVFRRSSLHSRNVPTIQTVTLQSVTGPWELQFPADSGAPPTASFPELTPWNESANPGIKYFSGRATYTTTVFIPSSSLHSGHRVLLDLGEVRELAEVSANGSAPTILWHGPYVCDLTGKVKPGENHIAISITNLWPNRLIGDKQPGATKHTYAPQSPYGPNSPLLRSGLLGPVKLVGKW
jgi:hypothetical protein